MTFDLDGIIYKSLGSNPINAEFSYQYQLIQLMLGFTSLEKNGVIFEQKQDYSTLPQVLQQGSYDFYISGYLLTFNNANNVASFIEKTRSDNREFYRELLCEFSNFFIQSENKSHTAAFIFLYRILEKVSYSAPLLYCSTAKDYIGTFNSLRTLFTSKDVGELGFFKQFLKEGNFIDQIMLDITYTIDLVSAYGYQDKYFNTLTDLYNNFASIDMSLKRVEINFQNICDLLIIIRNRFFHSRSGDSNYNIKMINIQNSDEFFECLNPIFCSFLALVTLQTISHKYSKI